MVYKAQIFNPLQEDDLRLLQDLKSLSNIMVLDTIDNQIEELLLCENPSLYADSEEYKEKYLSFTSRIKDLTSYGLWVYFPWKNVLTHILPKEEFIKVRTNRNQHKITPEQQKDLSTKKVGVVGLSVGRTVATTIALERAAGEIRLADFDNIELSNLNRIKAPISEMGLNKAIACAREIAEIDPFINVKCYTDGITENNLLHFLKDNGPLDLVIEECDDIGVKLSIREACKEHSIPVIMETSDNCVIDIERFDLEENRPLFHGKLEEFSSEDLTNARTIEEKTLILSRILDINKASKTLLYSLSELGKSIRSWPQLSSDVTYGGGVCAWFCREILLGKPVFSGQGYLGIKDWENYKNLN